LSGNRDFAEDEVPDDQKQFTRINAVYFTSKEEARALTDAAKPV